MNEHGDSRFQTMSIGIDLYVYNFMWNKQALWIRLCAASCFLAKLSPNETYFIHHKILENELMIDYFDEEEE